MKSRYKIAALGGLAAVSGAVACWKWMIRMPLKEFTRYALYMAAMDDETCRNELEGNQIGDEVIKFPPKEKTLQNRYHLKEFTRYALYMAAMDDETCRNELEGNQIGDEVIKFPPKEKTLQNRYHLFLQMNRAKSRRQLQKEIAVKE